MKRVLPVALACALIASPALAVDRYISLSSGLFAPGNTSALSTSGSQVSTSYDTGWSLGGAYGVAFDSPLRLESELVYRQAPAKGADDMWNLAWMMNVWFDLKNSSAITPYAGFGFGFGRGHVASPGPVDNSGTGVAYQAGGGIDFRMNQKLSLDVGYRYFGISELSTDNSISEFNPTGQSITGAVRVRF